MYSDELFEAIAKGKSSYTIPRPTKKGMPAKKRGRKPGSKNKPKVEKEVEKKKEEQPKVPIEKPKTSKGSFMGVSYEVTPPFRIGSFNYYKFLKGAEWAKKLFEYPKKEMDKKWDTAEKNLVRFKGADEKTRKREFSIYMIGKFFEHPINVLGDKISRIAHKKAGLSMGRNYSSMIQGSYHRAFSSEPFWYGVVSVATALRSQVSMDDRHKYIKEIVKDFSEKVLDLKVDSKGEPIVVSDKEILDDTKKELKKLSSRKVSDKKIKDLIMKLPDNDKRHEALKFYVELLDFEAESKFHKKVKELKKMKEIMGKDWWGR